MISNIKRLQKIIQIHKKKKTQNMKINNIDKTIITSEYDYIVMNKLKKQTILATFAESLLCGRQTYFIPYRPTNINNDFIIRDNKIFWSKYNQNILNWMKDIGLNYDIYLYKQNLPTIIPFDNVKLLKWLDDNMIEYDYDIRQCYKLKSIIPYDLTSIRITIDDDSNLDTKILNEYNRL